MESSEGSEEDEIIDLSGDDLDLDSDATDDPIEPRSVEPEPANDNEEFEPLKFTNGEDATNEGNATNEEDYQILTTTASKDTLNTTTTTPALTTTSETTENISPTDSNNVLETPIETNVASDDVIGAKARYYYIFLIFAEIRALTELIFYFMISAAGTL